MKFLYLPLVLASLTWAADAVYVPPRWKFYFENDCIEKCALKKAVEGCNCPSTTLTPTTKLTTTTTIKSSRTPTPTPSPPIPTDPSIPPDIIDPLPFPKCGPIDAPGCGAGESCIDDPRCAPGSQCRGLCVPFRPAKPDPNAPLPTPIDDSLIGTDFSDPPPLPPNCGPIDAPGCGASESCVDDPKCPQGAKCRGVCVPYVSTIA